MSWAYPKFNVFCYAELSSFGFRNDLPKKFEKSYLGKPPASRLDTS